MVTTMEAVLFDMDGTLVETEQLWGVALAELARRLGGELSAAARQATVGTSMRVAIELVYADVGRHGSDEQLRADASRVEQAVGELMEPGVSWRPGARELLAEVRAAGLPTALVTTTPRRLTRLVLRHIEADVGRHPFDVTVCGDEVPARKPDPAPYRQAMAALGVQPSGCVVVEDSLAGITAGLAAGAAVLGVPALQPLAPAPGLRLLPTLAGVGLAGLRDVLAARDAVELPA
jgi:HAD superfamily hydrolase (TIGR01509 family)